MIFPPFSPKIPKNMQIPEINLINGDTATLKLPTMFMVHSGLDYVSVKSVLS